MNPLHHLLFYIVLELAGLIGVLYLIEHFFIKKNSKKKVATPKRDIFDELSQTSGIPASKLMDTNN